MKTAFVAVLLYLIIALVLTKPVLAKILCNPTLCPPTPTPEINLANYHPVILIHGLGGVPEDWHMADQNYVKLLEDQGYPVDYIKEYVYADSDGDPTTYDYQGDIVKISSNMKNDVEELSQLSFSNKGDGKVDLVGYSLGGLIAREYLHENPADNKIRKLITVGTPHRGVYLLWLDKIADVFPDSPLLIRTQLHQLVNQGIWSYLGSENRQSPDLNSDAVQEVRPDSEFLVGLNNLTMIVKHPSYYTLYGDIDASIGFQVFIYKFSYKMSLGDLMVLPNSAAGIPYSPTSRYSFSDAEDFSVGVSGDTQNGFGFSIDLLTMKDENYKHTKLLKQAQIQSTIVDILTG